MEPSDQSTKAVPPFKPLTNKELAEELMKEVPAAHPDDDFE